MTAYGRASVATPLGQVALEIQSVNRKVLEISISLPKELLSFELELRKWIAAQVERGQVSVRLSLQSGRVPAAPQLKKLKAFWEEAAKALGYKPKEVVTFEFLARQLERELPQEALPPGMKRALEKLAEEALKELIQMKLKEGKSLIAALEKCLHEFEQALSKVVQLSKHSSKHYHQKLLERIGELGARATAEDERIVKEVALFAERVDITEEIDRLRSHTDQFKQLFKSSERSIGRTMDFLVQEMQREVHTIASKTAETEVSKLTIAMRGELEKIREQVQNIE